MANVIKTVLTYNLNGSTRDFNIPFEYLTRKFVAVTLLGRDRKPLVMNTDYRFATRTTISTTKAWGPADGYTQIEIRRNTSATERLVDFTDGSILRAYDLNVAQIQTMHIAEEARDLTADTIGVNNDGDLDARNRKIVNLANAVNDRDAVPFGQLKTMNQNSWQARNEAQGFRNEAQRFRNEAEQFKNQASTSASGAATSRNEALTYRNQAEQFKNNAASSSTSASNSATAASNSQTAALTSERNAATHESRARAEADRAKTEADKLGNWNALAGTIHEVSGQNVTFKNMVYANLGFGIRNSQSVWWKDQFRLENGNYADRYVRVHVWGAESRSNVMEWTDTHGWMMYIQRKTWGQQDVYFVVNGIANCKKLETDYVSNTGQYRTAFNYGGGWGDLTDNAALFNQLAGNQDGDTFYPVVSAKGRRSTGYPTKVSFGVHSMGRNTFHQAAIAIAGDNNTRAFFTFNINGTMSCGSIATNGNIKVGAATFGSNGDVNGTAWGGWLSDWCRNNTVNRIQMGAAQYAACWNNSGIDDGGGKVLTGAINGNRDAFIDGVKWRVMQFVRNNGTAYNIY